MKRRLITMKNPTTALGVSSYPVFSEKLLLLLQERDPGETRCVWWRLFAPESDFPRNLEFGIGYASLNLGWSLELGTQKWNSCEAFVCMKKQWKLMPWKGSVNQGGRITSLQSEWSLSKCCLKVFFLILRIPKPGSASAFEFKRYPLSYCHVPICAWVHASGYLLLVTASIWLSLALTVHLPLPVFLLSPGSVIFKEEEPSRACPYWCLCGVELKIVWETWGQVKMKSRKKYPVFFHFFGQCIQLILSVSSIQTPCNVQRVECLIQQVISIFMVCTV